MLNQWTNEKSMSPSGASAIRVKGFILMVCTLSVFATAGCRGSSKMRSMNPFARNSEPSAELLAGTGPSTTYPAPPSTSATPQAIASIAGGTQAPSSTTTPSTMPANPMDPSGTMQVAGFNVSPGTATPQTNFAAAQANGVYGQPASTPSTATNGLASTNSYPGTSAAKPSPYTFGSKSFEPKATPQTAPAVPPTSYASAASSYQAPGSQSLGSQSPSGQSSGNSVPGIPAMGGQTPSYEPPKMAATTSSTSESNSGPSSGGFSLPSNLPNLGSAISSITPPNSTSTGSAYSLPEESPTMNASIATTPDTTAPGATTASYATANAAGSLGGRDSAGTIAPSSYTPGSTGQASGYPSGKESPTTSGSFYR
ncbi:hypothetical protein N9N28_03335 [Rubripirellula amarantea]|nr:hypothetical protein [Rubripirellula amarantea]